MKHILTWSRVQTLRQHKDGYNKMMKAWLLLLLLAFALQSCHSLRWVCRVTQWQGKRLQHRLYSSNSPAMSGGDPLEISSRINSKSFIISPSNRYEEEELMILDNFSQIQMGERSKIGIIGTQELSETHQQMIELLSYALVLSGNHVYTSGGGNGTNGTNLAVIRGALRACNTDLLTVILPQSLFMQPSEMQVLLSRVTNLIETPLNDKLELREAANLCNARILQCVNKALVFAYHDSTTLLSSLNSVEGKIEITKFFLD